MGSDDVFKKRKAERQKRKYETKNPYPDSFLIITEGECTEPFYFEGLKKVVQNKAGRDNISIKVYGQGYNTVSLVNSVEQIISEEKILYKEIWVVFDKDDFQHFDEAIISAEKKGYQAAWSNPSFEYWLLLHFQYVDGALHRSDIQKKLNDIFKAQIGKRYIKGDSDLFDDVTVNGSLKKAISHAAKIRDNYGKLDKPSKCDPCTTVDLLVKKFENYLGDSVT